MCRPLQAEAPAAAAGSVLCVTPDPRPSRIKSLAAFLGLAEAPGGDPLPGGPKRSRFGAVSPRLDQEIEDLRRRVTELERLLRERDAGPCGPEGP